MAHYIEEKVDGSQFSMGLFRADDGDLGPDYYLRIRSKGAEMNTDAPEKMFNKAAETARRLASAEALSAGVGLHPGWTYRCEYLQKPKHNTLAYDRVPTHNLILFDVSTGDNEWLSPDDKRAEANRLGLECVPVLWAWNASPAAGASTSLEQLRSILDNTDSVLGGQKIEGVVIKQFGTDGYLYGMDHKTLIGKFVSEKFREAHGIAWKESNPSNNDILMMLGAKYQHVGRWMKAVQHMRDAGSLEGSPRDIGKLLIEIEKDLGKEEKEEIKTLLWKWAWPHVRRMATRGVAEWYKNELLRAQFEDEIIAPAEPIPEGATITLPGPPHEPKHATFVAAGKLHYDEATDRLVPYDEPSSASR